MERNRAIEKDRHSVSRSHIPWLEWLASGLGLLMALCVFGFIGWQTLDDATSPPAITVTSAEVAQIAGGYRVIFEAHNVGGEAAAQVRIEGMVSGSGSPETSSVTLDYIPGHSRRKGGLFFTQNPQSGTLTLRAAGFAKP
jgi:uncharacterized protein (TIGR02588 family)